MKKKLLISIMSLMLVLTLSACGKEKESVKDNNNSNEKTEVTNTNNSESTNDVVSTNGTSEDSSGVNEFKALYSDQNKMVFQYTDNSKIVFHHNGTKITGYELYFDYEDAATANLAKQTIINENSEDVKNVRVEGSMIIVTYAESTYEDLTLEDVRMVYSYLTEVTK